MQAVLFEIQLIRSRSATVSGKSFKRNDSEISYKFGKPEHSGDNLKPEDAIAGMSLEQAGMARRGSHGIKSILLKGEMRYLKEINVLVFLCSPL